MTYEYVGAPQQVSSMGRRCPVSIVFPNKGAAAQRPNNRHALVPHGVKIKVGRTVNFIIAGFHQVAVYGDGKFGGRGLLISWEPEAIDRRQKTGCPPTFVK